MINWFQQYHSSEFISDLIKTQSHLFVAEEGIGADQLIENLLKMKQLNSYHLLGMGLLTMK